MQNLLEPVLTICLRKDGGCLLLFWVLKWAALYDITIGTDD